MSRSNFPKGFPQGVIIRGVPLNVCHPGKIFFVSSVSGANGNAGTIDRPFATIDYAVGRCTANKGDIICVLPGHTETVTAAAGLALDVAGIAVVGLGSGSNRPTINFTTATTADMNVDAANITLYNLLFTGGVDALAGPIDINAADCAIINCEYRDVTGQATDVIVADANANRLLIDGYFHNGAAAAGGASAIALTGMTNPEIRNFKIVGNFSVAGIDCRTTAVVDLDIHDGYIWTKNAADTAIKDTITASTGKIGPNINVMLTDNAANITEALSGATFHYFGGATTKAASLLICNLAGEAATGWNGTESTDA